MQLAKSLIAGALMLSVAAGSALAQSDKAKKQAEIRATATSSLDEFFAKKPELKADVAKAPGYGLFTTYGLSFLVGGSGGSGLVHNAKTNKDTFMSMAQASAGLQAGISESKMLIVFNDANAMNTFVNKGWVVGAGGGAGAGAGSKNVGSGQGQNMIAGGTVYTLTKNGLEIGGAVAGTKFWKDKSLN